jgi:hypothetical protein
MALRSLQHGRLGLRWRLFGLISTAAFAVAVISAPSSAQSPQPAAAAERPGPDYGPPVRIYRGVVPNWTPVWIELADIGGGRFVMTALDGLADGEGPLRTYLLQSNGRRGSACRLRSVDGFDISFRRCPDDQMNGLDANLMGISSTAVMVPVPADEAFGYGATVQRSSASAFDSVCSFQRLSRRDIFPSGLAARSGEQLVQSLSTRRARLSALEGLDGLRMERLNAINLLVFTSGEMQQLSYIDQRMARITDFRYRTAFMQQRQQLEQQFANRPDRVAARQRIAEIDGRLATIYDPSTFGGATAASDPRAAAALFAATDRAIAEEMRQNAPLPAERAVSIETALDELDSCAALNGLTTGDFSARRDLASQFALIAPQFQQTLNAAFEGAADSSALTAQLQLYRRSAGLTAALANIGASDVFASADARVQALANAETRRREAAARQSAQAQARQRQADAARQTARAAPTVTSRSTSGAPAGTRGGAPSARQIRDALVYENTFGRVTVADAMGIGQRSADYDAGISSVTILGVTFDVTFAVDSPQCRAAGRGQFSCSYALNINNSLGLPFSGRGSHTFEVRDGIWRSPTYLAAIIESGNRSAASANNGRNCTLQGFGTPEGASIRDQNGTPC